MASGPPARIHFAFQAVDRTRAAAPHDADVLHDGAVDVVPFAYQVLDGEGAHNAAVEDPVGAVVLRAHRRRSALGEAHGVQAEHGALAPKQPHAPVGLDVGGARDGAAQTRLLPHLHNRAHGATAVPEDVPHAAAFDAVPFAYEVVYRTGRNAAAVEQVVAAVVRTARTGGSAVGEAHRKEAAAGVAATAPHRLSPLFGHFCSSLKFDVRVLPWYSEMNTCGWSDKVQ